MTTEAQSKYKKTKDSVTVNGQGTRLNPDDADAYNDRGYAKIELGSQ